MIRDRYPKVSILLENKNKSIKTSLLKNNQKLYYISENI